VLAKGLCFAASPLARLFFTMGWKCQGQHWISALGNVGGWFMKTTVAQLCEDNRMYQALLVSLLLQQGGEVRLLAADIASRSKSHRLCVRPDWQKRGVVLSVEKLEASDNSPVISGLRHH
jgi:hypothetical protein